MPASTPTAATSTMALDGREIALPDRRARPPLGEQQPGRDRLRRGARRRSRARRARRSPASARRAGRGQRHRLEPAGGAITLIDESYNANPASMRAALALLATAPGRKLAALGDMLELGDAGAGAARGAGRAGRRLRRRPRVHRRPRDAPSARRAAAGAARRARRQRAPSCCRSSRPSCGPATRCWSRARSASAWGGWSSALLAEPGAGRRA